MILKRLPEDFQVEELTSVAPSRGRFAFYRLTKRNVGTPEAIDAIARRWRIPRSRISCGGLKDRHAQTSQMLTIEQGPRHGLKQTNLELSYLGQVDRPFTSADIRANHFRIVIRDLSDDDVRQLRDRLESVRRNGVPNYFDAQRFGSQDPSGDFIAEALVRGDYERAIKLVMANDRSQQHTRIVAHLAAHPGDFYGAWPLVRADMRWLYLSAFQSFLWNRMLTLWLDQPSHSRDPQAADQQLARLPFPSGRIPEDNPFLPLVDQVLAERGLTRKHMKIDYPRGTFFSRGDRAAFFVPQNLADEVADDDLYSGRRKLTLDFELPRGCYATTFLRRIEIG